MKKIKNRKIGKWVAMATLAMGVLACETTRGTFEEFTRQGETIYVGTADTVLVGSGFNKLRFWVAINADPKITSGVLTTIDKSINHEFELVRTKSGKDTISFDLDIPEGEYTFGVFLKDKAGNSSVRREVPAKVYGDSYQSGLVNRGITQIETFVQGAAFNWAEPSTNMTKTTLTYEDKNGVMQSVVVPNGESRTLVDSYKLGGRVSIMSTFKPTALAIEEFDAIAVEREFPMDFLLDKSLISALRLPGDATDGCHGSTYERLLDGSLNDYWHSCESPEDKYPFIMSFDLGVQADLSRFKFDERKDCCGNRGPNAYQIWVSNDLGLGETANIDEVGLEAWEADAQAKGWTKLVDVTGNTQYTFTTAIPETGKKYKYFRFVAISSINGDGITNFNELSFYGK